MSASDQIRAITNEMTSASSITPAYVEGLAARLNAVAAQLDAPAADPVAAEDVAATAEADLVIMPSTSAEPIPVPAAE